MNWNERHKKVYSNNRIAVITHQSSNFSQLFKLIIYSYSKTGSIFHLITKNHVSISNLTQPKKALNLSKYDSEAFNKTLEYLNLCIIRKWGHTDMDFGLQCHEMKEG